MEGTFGYVGLADISDPELQSKSSAWSSGKEPRTQQRGMQLTTAGDDMFAALLMQEQ